MLQQCWDAKLTVLGCLACGFFLSQKIQMLGIFTYIWLMFMVNVRSQYHTLSVWVFTLIYNIYILIYIFIYIYRYIDLRSGQMMVRSLSDWFPEVLLLKVIRFDSPLEAQTEGLQDNPSVGQRNCWLGGKGSLRHLQVFHIDSDSHFARWRIFINFHI